MAVEQKLPGFYNLPSMYTRRGEAAKPRITQEDAFVLIGHIIYISSRAPIKEGGLPSGSDLELMTGISQATQDYRSAMHFLLNGISERWVTGNEQRIAKHRPDLDLSDPKTAKDLAKQYSYILHWQYGTQGVFDGPQLVKENGEITRIHKVKPRTDKMRDILGLLTRIELDHQDQRRKVYTNLMYSMNEPARWEDDGGTVQDFATSEDLWTYTLKP